ncbi:MAG TPA: LptF/LptG family permease [Chitinophagaceae bacterium]|nr:LptF/LptG family permease [Chitinophagaceae bacterium]MCB9054424.1 LptF/LptG family permease [Chitinophagales bacterium]HPG11474.1 LptF/LptG family permease [Chitinophagaceae bacterium]
MFKKLDKLIIKAFIGPFAATFFITLLVLVMQFFWLYIDDFVGKGIGTGVIFEFILYQSAVLVPLALPLAVLLSSLMSFGNLGESFELVAIKSAGISLLRFMRPLLIVSVLIAGVAFLFSNYVIPVANLKSRTLLADIVYAKPAFDLKEGVFYDKISGFAIKIGKKEANDSIIRDVIVYEQGNPLQDNFIIAKSGVMRVTENKRFLEFNLKDGWRYQERGNQYDRGNSEYVRIRFDEYNKQFDLSTLGFSNRTADSVNKNSERVLSIRQLSKAIDSLKKEIDKTSEQTVNNMFRQVRFAGVLDSQWRKPVADSIGTKSQFKDMDELLPDSAKANVYQSAQNIAASMKINAEGYVNVLKEKNKVLRKHKIEWHRKIVLSLACVVLFLVGAPLGSIIRKGGLGTPLIFAIVFFMVFYFSSTTGEKFAKENTFTPFTGMWLATFVLLPIGLFLTYKAMHDSQLFNKEFYTRLKRSVKRIWNKSRNK